MSRSSEVLVGTHWGDFLVSSRQGEPTSVRPSPADEDPSPIGNSILDIANPSVRIAKPMVRKGYYERGALSDGAARGHEPFVAVSWDTALDLAANAIRDVRDTHGNEAIFGGSYGWSSAGRFHHAQSQVHRFLNAAGGYVAGRDTYSAAAAEVIVPRILGLNPLTILDPNWEEIAEHTDLLVAFGGICPRNSQVIPGGIANHSDMRQLRQVADRGVEVVSISPMQLDTPDFMRAQWLAPGPRQMSR